MIRDEEGIVPTTLDIKTLQGLQAFHGHICPGYAGGIRVGEAALREMGVRDVDEEIVAVVETDSCAVDGIQYLLGCTFGKGNLLHLDHGQHVFTVARREDGYAVRITLRSVKGPMTLEQRAAAERISQGLGWGPIDEAADPDWKTRSLILLSADERDLLDIQGLDDYVIPDKATIHRSIPCDGCGRATMATRLRRVGDRLLCVACSQRAAIDEYVVRPIGVVHNELARGVSSRGAVVMSDIELDGRYALGLQGLAVGDRIQVLFYLDGVEGQHPLLQHQQGDRTKPEQGVFTLRSQNRPNPIGLTTVTVKAIEGHVLTVQGLDAWDETPVIDLKPVTVADRRGH